MGVALIIRIVFLSELLEKGCQYRTNELSVATSFLFFFTTVNSHYIVLFGFLALSTTPNAMIVMPTTHASSSYLTLSAHVRLILLLILFSIPLSAQQNPVNSAEFDFLPQAKTDISRFASPDMAGRGYTSGGHLRAAEYLQKRFEEIGLQRKEGSYLQPLPVTVDTFKQTPTLSINGQKLRFGHEFTINPGNKGRSKNKIPLVFLGAGLIVEQHGINNFEGKDLRGKVAVIDSETPESIAADTTINPALLTRETRIKNAIKAHASGIILLVDRPSYGNFFERWTTPVFELQREALPANGIEATFSVKRATRVLVETNNVIGYLPGNGNTDSTLIICAHYDHLGMIGPDGPFFPGANDNASGTALMLALAKRFKEQPLRFNLLFVAFGAEEIGLYGSRYFAEHPPVDLSTVRFLVNLDMAASGLEGVMALGGVDFPEEFALLQEVHDQLGLPELRKRKNAPNSDHWFILERGVRGFYIYPFTGQQPYHHVDDLPETLQWQTFNRMYRLIEGFLQEL